jgi:sulfide:quinone oxidoreductase
MASKHHQIVIVGGGTAGITVAARFLRADNKLDVAIIDPAQKHYYQPAWTLVGAGVFDYKDTERDEAGLIPKNVTWIQQAAQDMLPDENKVTLANGDEVTYDYLVVCPGIQIDLNGIEGLADAMGKGDVCSNYVDPNYTWEVLQNFKGGNALFAQPATLIKCGGAPQKIMYLADDYFQKKGVKDKTNVVFATPGSVIFGVSEFAKTLMEVVNRKQITLKFFHRLHKIDAEQKKAYFTLTTEPIEGCVITHNPNNAIREEILGNIDVAIPYDMLHLAPPQSAPDFVKRSKLAHQEGPEKGWVNVDINTLQHRVYPNVFSLGDVAALPTAKTGAAVRKQAPVLVGNIMHLIQNKGAAMNPGYHGYSSCPLVTGYGKMVLAEFKYNNVRDSDKLISTFIDTTKEQYSMWLLKMYGLPYIYWNLMLKGKM